jgi:2-C-methyl-D-erythritol 2,4-cyclodiphosphate synthase
VTVNLRIGLGVDTHRLEAGQPCRLGGVEIPSGVGPVGHSDGDAVLHAACDAVLGAAGLEDLGSLFPDDEPANRDRDSREFCGLVLEQLARHGLEVVSLDIVVEAEQPRLAPHRQAIRESLAALFGVNEGCVNVKGKTAEGLGSIGRGEALRVTAVALLEKVG